MDTGVIMIFTFAYRLAMHPPIISQTILQAIVSYYVHWVHSVSMSQPVIHLQLVRSNVPQVHTVVVQIVSVWQCVDHHSIHNLFPCDAT